MLLVTSKKTQTNTSYRQVISKSKARAKLSSKSFFILLYLFWDIRWLEIQIETQATFHIMYDPCLII